MVKILVGIDRDGTINKDSGFFGKDVMLFVTKSTTMTSKVVNSREGEPVWRSETGDAVAGSGSSLPGGAYQATDWVGVPPLCRTGLLTQSALAPFSDQGGLEEQGFVPSLPQRGP